MPGFGSAAIPSYEIIVSEGLVLHAISLAEIEEAPDPITVTLPPETAELVVMAEAVAVETTGSLGVEVPPAPLSKKRRGSTPVSRTLKTPELSR